MRLVVAAIVAAIGAPVAAALPAPTSTPLAVAAVFHVAPPASTDASLAAADVALRAPEEIGEALHALHSHPSAKLAFALDPAYLAALGRAASGASALSLVASGEESFDQQQTQVLLDILARHRPLDPRLARTRAGARYLTLATSAGDAISAGRRVSFSSHELADFAGSDARIVLAASGLAASPSDPLADSDAIRQLAAADKAIADELKADVRAGTVEILALPDGEPILPLLIDAGGKSTTDTRIVNLAAGADARRLCSDAVHAVAAFAVRPAGLGIGIYSPYGAYDDATGPVFKQSGASFALFSDRVVRGAGGAGTESGIEALDASALHPYALTVDRGVTLPVLFWSENDSADAQTALGADTSMAQRVVAVGKSASQRPHSGAGILVLRIEAEGTWSQRPDAAAVVGKVVVAIASGQAGQPTTPSQFLRAHPATASAYGYPAMSESGSLALWMGSNDQASLWKALAAARTAAGGDAAMTKQAVQPLLAAAEAGTWFSAVSTPVASTGRKLGAFRSLIAAIYRAVGATPPSVIAPVKGQTPAPTPLPGASPTPSHAL